MSRDLCLAGLCWLWTHEVESEPDEPKMDLDSLDVMSLAHMSIHSLN